MRRVKKILSNVLGVEEGSITKDSSPDTIPSWDSFNALLLVSALEEEFRVSFTLKEVADVFSVGDILGVLEKRDVIFYEDEQ